MRSIIGYILAAWVFAANGPVLAAPVALSSTLQPLGFLVGHWTAKSGKAENGVLARGISSIEPAAAGTALLRRDRTDLLNADGTPRTSFEQVMLIYPEGGALHADYFDGEHAIHYVSAVIDPGKSVTFLTAPTPGPPHFRLTYAIKSPGVIGIKFEMAPPGADAFRTIAEGEAVRD